MPRFERCPACGNGEVALSGAGRLRCAQCGATYRYRTQWLPLLVAIVGLAAVVGAIFGLLMPNASRRVAIMVPLLIVGGLSLHRYFRTLEKV